MWYDLIVFNYCVCVVSDWGFSWWNQRSFEKFGFQTKRNRKTTYCCQSPTESQVCAQTRSEKIYGSLCGACWYEGNTYERQQAMFQRTPTGIYTRSQCWTCWVETTPWKGKRSKPWFSDWKLAEGTSVYNLDFLCYCEMVMHIKQNICACWETMGWHLLLQFNCQSIPFIPR